MWRVLFFFCLFIALYIRNFSESFLPRVIRVVEHSTVERRLSKSYPLATVRSSSSALFASPRRSKEATYEEDGNGDLSNIPSPLNNIVDVNIERNSVVYELTLSKDLGFEINQGFETPVVGKVRLPSISFLTLFIVLAILLLRFMQGVKQPRSESFGVT